MAPTIILMGKDQHEEKRKSEEGDQPLECEQEVGELEGAENVSLEEDTPLAPKRGRKAGPLLRSPDVELVSSVEMSQKSADPFSQPVYYSSLDCLPAKDKEVILEFVSGSENIVGTENVTSLQIRDLLQNEHVHSQV